jgi:hypothetical protein
MVVGPCSKHEIVPVLDLRADDDQTGPSLPSFWQVQRRFMRFFGSILQTLPYPEMSSQSCDSPSEGPFRSNIRIADLNFGCLDLKGSRLPLNTGPRDLPLRQLPQIRSHKERKKGAL